MRAQFLSRRQNTNPVASLSFSHLCGCVCLLPRLKFVSNRPGPVDWKWFPCRAVCCLGLLVSFSKLGWGGGEEVLQKSRLDSWKPSWVKSFCCKWLTCGVISQREGSVLGERRFKTRSLNSGENCPAPNKTLKGFCFVSDFLGVAVLHRQSAFKNIRFIRQLRAWLIASARLGSFECLQTSSFWLGIHNLLFSYLLKSSALSWAWFYKVSFSSQKPDWISLQD